MLEKVIGLFERLVVAHEKLAASQEAILNVGNAQVEVPPAPTAEPEKPKATRAKKEKAADPVETPKAEEPKKEEPKPEPVKLTLADVKAAVASYAENRMKGGSPQPKEDARALMAHHGGGAKKTDEIAEEYWADVVGACKSGWEPLPAKDEEL